MTEENARRAVQKFMEAAFVAEASIAALEPVASPRALAFYRSRIGQFIAWLSVELLAPLWKRYPELEPEVLKGAALSPAVARVALSALQEARTLVEQGAAAALVDATPRDAGRLRARVAAVLHQAERAEAEVLAAAAGGGGSGGGAAPTAADEPAEPEPDAGAGQRETSAIQEPGGPVPWSGAGD